MKMYGAKGGLSQAEQTEVSMQIIRQIIKGILARKQVTQMRQEEMQFLGMVRRPQTAKELRDPNNPLRMRERVCKTRRQERDQAMLEFEAAKEQMYDMIMDAEQEDIIESEIRKR